MCNIRDLYKLVQSEEYMYHIKCIALWYVYSKIILHQFSLSLHRLLEIHI
jgi:hypothetical protein